MSSPPTSTTQNDFSSASTSAQRIDEARTAVTATLASAGASLDNEMRTRAADLHANSTAISKQEAQLSKQTTALSKESAQLEKLLASGTKKLNEVGDIQNWAEMLERDLLVLEETVRIVEGKGEEESASGTGGRRW